MKERERLRVRELERKRGRRERQLMIVTPLRGKESYVYSICVCVTNDNDCIRLCCLLHNKLVRATYISLSRGNLSQISGVLVVSPQPPINDTRSVMPTASILHTYLSGPHIKYLQ